MCWQVVVSSYSSVEEVVSSVVESPVVDQELIEEAVDEEETFTEVPTTTPSSIDLQASGGDLPGTVGAGFIQWI